MKKPIAILTATMLLVAMFGGVADAAVGAGTVYIYSPVLSKPWYYSQLDHNGYLGTNVARDVRDDSWTSSESVLFTAATAGAVSLQAFVQTAGVNCTSGGPDNWVRLNIYSDGTYRGDLAYVHLRTLSVTQGTWISTNTTLGTIQNAASCCASDGGTCWTGIHVHMEHVGGTWTTGAVGESHPYSTPVITFVVPGGPFAPVRSPSTLAGPVK